MHEFNVLRLIDTIFVNIKYDICQYLSHCSHVDCTPITLRGPLGFTCLCGWFGLPLLLLLHQYYTRHHTLTTTASSKGRTTCTSVST